MKKIFFIFTFLLITSNLHAQSTVFLKTDEALKQMFASSKEVVKEEHVLKPDQIEKAKQLLGYVPAKSAYNFYVGKTDSKVEGYALIDDEVGKVQPITFISRINPDGKVERVEIMVYRESHGGEVTSKRFLNQFKGKASNDELRLHGSIVNVSGATLSSHALVKGVKRALVLWQILYGK